MAGIPEHIIEQVQDRTDIVEIIGGYMPLKKAGRNFKANCPFHHEKTPSFMVSQDKQIFHCFGCGAGGNVFNFLMKYERLEFPEAVRALAQKAGIAIPAESSESREQGSLGNKLYAANEVAMAFFQANLSNKSGAQAYNYLIKRGLSSETIASRGLGLAASGWDPLLNFARQKDIAPDILAKAGLAIEKDGGGYFDRFRNRIMFPIFDIKSRVLGFGGRVCLSQDSGPKYMNSPETSIYNKGRNLYGLNTSWNHIRDADQVVIVEGYFDLILPFQSGVKNMVASLGTSLTEDQIRLLGRYTKNAVIIFDPDRAGEFATLRSLDLLVEEDFRIGVVRLPEGYDPDSFVRQYGAEEFKKRISGAKSLFDYKMSVLVSRHDSSSVEGKAKIVEEMLPTLSRIPNAVLKSGYIKKLTDALSIDEEAVRQELKKIKPGYSARRDIEGDKRPEEGAFNKKCRQSEKVLAGLLIDDASFIKLAKENLGLEDFSEPDIRTVISVLYEMDSDSKTLTPGKLINCLKDKEAHKLVPGLVDCVEEIVDRERTLMDCILRIKQDNLKEKLNRLQVEIALAQDASDEDKITKLISECNSLLRSIKQYERGQTKEAQNETVKA
ncbi:MAG: DNA primase [Candidatus Omnitrophica bacterium]|nr:DNA primase [Candidatus Omnitrophota bacterium]